MLIIDEIGYLTLGAAARDLLFQLVNARYERGAMILTSNRGCSGWGSLFGDPVTATALLDRLLCTMPSSCRSRVPATACASTPSCCPRLSALRHPRRSAATAPRTTTQNSDQHQPGKLTGCGRPHSPPPECPAPDGDEWRKLLRPIRGNCRRR
ncbi:ATP-binding protein [Asaia sp. As-1742]|uniref:ATP-binding protein n=1 Tax=Asaia sp. As-1742 TaxID=2608325 RepID=UPI002714ADBC|nr:ATP-binding protein [Asaia sp. As-1742]